MKRDLQRAGEVVHRLCRAYIQAHYPDALLSRPHPEYAIGASCRRLLHPPRERHKSDFEGQDGSPHLLLVRGPAPPVSSAGKGPGSVWMTE